MTCVKSMQFYAKRICLALNLRSNWKNKDKNLSKILKLSRFLVKIMGWWNWRRVFSVFRVGSGLSWMT